MDIGLDGPINFMNEDLDGVRAAPTQRRVGRHPTCERLQREKDLWWKLYRDDVLEGF